MPFLDFRNQSPRPGKILAALLALTLTGAALAADDLSPAQPPVDELAKAAGVTLGPRPWHMADIWWNFPKPIEHFETLSEDVTIDRDIPSTYDLYISPVGIAKISGLSFYGGLQTNVNGWRSDTDHARVFPGKGAIFSRWSEDEKHVKIGVSEVRMAADGLCESAGYEGNFCSVRRPYAWTKGTYTYTVTKGDTETVNGKPMTWFHCILTCHETGAVTWIGSLRFAGTDFTFWPMHAAFLEVYSTTNVPASDLPKVTVTFGYPRINGAAPPLKKATVNYNGYAKMSQSPPCAKAHADGSNIVVEMGPIFQRAKSDDSVELPVTAPAS